MTKVVIMEIFALKQYFRTKYEKKCFIIGITNILTVFDAPDIVKDPATSSRLIQEILSMLYKVKQKETKLAKKKASKQIHN